MCILFLFKTQFRTNRALEIEVQFTRDLNSFSGLEVGMYINTYEEFRNIYFMNGHKESNLYFF